MSRPLGAPARRLGMAIDRVYPLRVERGRIDRPRRRRPGGGWQRSPALAERTEVRAGG